MVNKNVKSDRWAKGLSDKTGHHCGIFGIKGEKRGLLGKAWGDNALYAEKL